MEGSMFLFDGVGLYGAEELAQALPEHGPFDATNLGIPGYSSYQGRRVAERARRARQQRLAADNDPWAIGGGDDEPADEAEDDDEDDDEEEPPPPRPAMPARPR